MSPALKKTFLWLATILGSLLLLLILLISPITEYLIEKHAKARTGRVILMEDLSINLLTGSISINGLQILEADDKTDFISCELLQTSINYLPAFRGIYVLPSTLIQGLKINVREKYGTYNFDDLIKRFAGDNDQKDENPPTPFFIHYLKLRNSAVTYTSAKDNISIPLKAISISLEEFNYKSTLLKLNYAFEIASGGKFDGIWQQNLRNNNYNLGIHTEGFNLVLLEQFLKPYMQLHAFTGMVDSKLQIAGNLDSSSNVIAKGIFTMKNLALTDPSQQPLMKTASLEMVLDSVNNGTYYYKLDHLKIDGFYARYELYENGDNWTRLMGQDSSAASEDTMDYSNPIKVLAVYINLMIQNYTVSRFYADNISFTNTAVAYADYSLSEPFNFVIDSGNFYLKNLNTSADRVVMQADMQLNRSGIALATISVNPRNAMDMDLEWEIKELPFGSFNPYTSYYAGYPFLKGMTVYKSTSSIRDGQLKSSNRFILLQPKVGDKKRSIYDVPLKLAVALLRDPKGNIDLDVPVEGNLNDPKYKLGKVIWKTILNILTKAVTAPYNLIANAANGGYGLENLNDFELKYTSVSFSEKQKEKLKVIVKGLLAKPELFVTITQDYDSLQEIEALSSVEARRRYATETGIINPLESSAESTLRAIDSIQTKDSLFISWLKVKTGNEIESNYEKCIRLIGRSELEYMQQRLVEARKQNFINELDSAGLPRNRYLVNASKSKLLPPGANPRFSYTVSEMPAGK